MDFSHGMELSSFYLTVNYWLRMIFIRDIIGTCPQLLLIFND